MPMFSSLTRNAVNTVLLVCKNQHNGPVTTLSISKRLGLSISYLEALLSKLKKCGFVVSYRGPGGGYCSNGKPSDLKLIDIIRSFDFDDTNKNSGKLKPQEFDKDLIKWMMQEFLENHLQHMNIEEVMMQMPDEIWGAEPQKPSSSEPRKFKPLQIHRLPSGPNSVFNLASSMAA
jgi:Rrf2 family iron-sulfur cluster assembly transcriptional regulator